MSTETIHKHICDLLIKNPTSEITKWNRVIGDAAKAQSDDESEGQIIHTRRGITFFAKIGNAGKDANKLLLSVRRQGVEVGTVNLDAQTRRRILRLGNSEELTKLLAAFPQAKEADAQEWTAPPVTALFNFLATLPVNLLSKELAIEEFIVNAIRKKEFCFGKTALVTVRRLAKELPFKLILPIRLDQNIKPTSTFNSIIHPATGHGAADIVTRAEWPICGQIKRRIAVLELKKPAGAAELALLQSYAYCCSLLTILDNNWAGLENVHKDTRALLRYSPNQSMFVAVAVVPDEDVDKVKNSRFTKTVLSEPLVQSGRVALRILGFSEAKPRSSVLVFTRASEGVNGTDNAWTKIDLAGP